MNKKKIQADLVELLKSTGSQNKKAAHVKGNAAGIHKKDVNKQNRQFNKQEERDAEQESTGPQ